MVHAYGAPSGDRAPNTPGVEREQTTAPTRYVFIPDPLITRYAHDPLTVGVYVAIARLTVVTKGAVPLAAADLAAWMGSSREADRAAIMRRIATLGADGWLAITRSPAAKHLLLPTWGQDRSGADRPWCFSQSACGRPDHLRGRRVPIGLFDTYLGRLDPQLGRRPALISRYFTRPLLDLTDIGTYTIGLRAEQAPTARLRHLKLVGEAGMLPPLDERVLFAQAAAEQVTTLDSDQDVVPVRLTIHGYARLGLPVPLAVASTPSEGTCRSDERSASRSLVEPCDDTGCTAPEPAADTLIRTTGSNAWDEGTMHERIKHDPPTSYSFLQGGCSVSACASVSDNAPISDDYIPFNHPLSGHTLLDPLVVAGHRQLNADRTIAPGEWWEILALQQSYSARQLLIWQARAARTPTTRPHGVTPAYYVACAEQEIQATRSFHTSIAPAAIDPRIGEQAGTNATDACCPKPSSPPGGQLDPRCRELLKAMGVRYPRVCAGASEALILQWQAVIDHPSLVARMADPIGFAVSQLRQQQPPPSIDELERWAERMRQRHDPYETWRHLPSVTLTSDQEAAAQERVARARALAPPDADEEAITYLVLWLEEGLSDTDAITRLRASHVDERSHGDEVCHG